jgi:predicted aspartyl protease
MATDYSNRYIPSAPVIAIRLSAPAKAAAERPVEALIDTGADFCIAPRAVLNRINARRKTSIRIRGQWSAPFQAARYIVDIHLEEGVLPAVDFIADPNGNEIILGRNVLNKLKLLLDGPAETLEILKG